MHLEVIQWQSPVIDHHRSSWNGTDILPNASGLGTFTYFFWVLSLRMQSSSWPVPTNIDPVTTGLLSFHLVIITSMLKEIVDYSRLFPSNLCRWAAFDCKKYLSLWTSSKNRLCVKELEKMLCAQTSNNTCRPWFFSSIVSKSFGLLSTYCLIFILPLKGIICASTYKCVQTFHNVSPLFYEFHITFYERYSYIRHKLYQAFVEIILLKHISRKTL